MGITAQQAIDTLKSWNALPESEAATVDQIIALVRSVDSSVPADRTVLLYSGDFQQVGDKMVQAYQIVNALVDAAPGKFFIDADTGYGLVLNATYPGVDGLPGISVIDQALKRAGIDTKNLSATKLPLWTEASVQLAEGANGAVLTISPYAELVGRDGVRKVFAGSELPALLYNSKVTTINGIPAEELKAAYIQDTADALAAGVNEPIALQNLLKRVSGASEGNLVGNLQLALQNIGSDSQQIKLSVSSDYFTNNNIQNIGQIRDADGLPALQFSSKNLGLTTSASAESLIEAGTFLTKLQAAGKFVGKIAVPLAEGALAYQIAQDIKNNDHVGYVRDVTAFAAALRGGEAGAEIGFDIAKVSGIKNPYVLGGILVASTVGGAVVGDTAVRNFADFVFSAHASSLDQAEADQADNIYKIFPGDTDNLGVLNNIWKIVGSLDAPVDLFNGKSLVVFREVVSGAGFVQTSIRYDILSQSYTTTRVTAFQNNADGSHIEFVRLSKSQTFSADDNPLYTPGIGEYYYRMVDSSGNILSQSDHKIDYVVLERDGSLVTSSGSVASDGSGSLTVQIDKTSTSNSTESPIAIASNSGGQEIAIVDPNGTQGASRNASGLPGEGDSTDTSKQNISISETTTVENGFISNNIDAIVFTTKFDRKNPIDSSKDVSETIQNIYAASEVGSIFGSTLGRALGGSDPFQQMVYSGTFGALAQSLVKGVAAEILTDSVAQFMKTTFAELPHDLGEAGIGTISSFLTAEIVGALGIHGLAGNALDAGAGAIIGQIGQQLFDGASISDALASLNSLNFAAQIGSSVGSLLGNVLANQVVSFDTVGGQIGSAIGSSLAVFGAALAIGGPIGLVAAVVVSFIGNIIGGLIGSIFGGTPRSGADSVWDSNQKEFVVANAWSRKGGSKQAAISLSESVNSNFNNIIAISGSTMLSPDLIQSGSYGMYKRHFTYRPVGGGSDKGVITQQFDVAQDLVTYGTYIGLSGMIGQMAGGDIYIKRAISYTLDSAVAPNPQGGNLGGSFDLQVLGGNITIAQDFEKYINNKGLISALINLTPNSNFTNAYIATLLQVSVLGLDRRNSTDWIGGWSIFLDERNDGKIDGKSLSPSQISFEISPQSPDRVINVWRQDGYFLGDFADTIDSREETKIIGSGSSEVIDIRGNMLEKQIGYVVDGHLNNDIALSGIDFTAQSGAVVNFSPSALRQSVSVAIINDGVAESIEQFVGKIAAGSNVSIVGGEARATILDGTVGLPTLLVGRSFALEGDYAIFRLSLSKVAAQDFTVGLSVADVTTTSGADYQAGIEVSADGVTGWASANSATFTAGGTELFARIKTNADNALNPNYIAPVPDPRHPGQFLSTGNGEPQYLNIEGNERFTLTATVTGGSAAIANQADVSGNVSVSGTGTIVDASTGTAALAWIDNVTVDESTGVAVFSVARSHAGASASVNFSTADTRTKTIDVAATVDAGAGNDIVYASDLGDNIFGGAGNDILVGGKLDDWLIGGTGDDVLDAGGGSGNLLDGGDGNDYLLGADGAANDPAKTGSDWLKGGAGDDVLFGRGGEDYLDGGQGNDRIDGGDGSDTVIFRRGDGHDQLADTGTSATQHDVLDLSSGIASTDVTLVGHSSGIDLSLLVGGATSGDRIDLVGAVTNLNEGMEEYRFSDGSWSNTNLATHAVLAKTAGSNLTGTSADETLTGTAYDDTLSGGGGHDTLVGGDGSDRYLFNIGDGTVAIDDTGSAVDVDAVVFGAGIQGSDLDVSYDAANPQSVILTVRATGDRLILLHQDLTNGASSIEEFRFSDGTTLTLRDIFDMGTGSAYGSTGNSTQFGGNGSNTLYGGDGDDTFTYNSGDGEVVIADGSPWSANDVLQFGAGISAADLILSRDPQNAGNVRISFANRSGSILLQNQDVNADYPRGIDFFHFADGTVWNRDQLDQKIVDRASSAGDDTIIDTYGSTTINAGAGNDYVDAGGGNDTLIGGTGNDTLIGGDGDDTYIYNVGDGNDVILDSSPWSGNDAIQFGAGISAADLVLSRDPQNSGDVRIRFTDHPGSILIQSQDVNADYPRGIDLIRFADGTTWDRNTLEQQVVIQAQSAGNDIIRDRDASFVINGGAGDDYIDAGGGNDTLIGGTGNDILIGGEGDDTYVYNPGDGNDLISDNSPWSGGDVIQFGAGITAADLLVTRGSLDPTTILISFTDHTGSILIQNQDINTDYPRGIDLIRFADGSTLSRDALNQLAITCSVSANNDIVRDTSASGTSSLIDAGAGDDYIDAGGGNDTLIGGTGNDILIGGEGDDTYVYNPGDGNDLISDNSPWSNDTIQFGAGISAADVIVTRDADPSNIRITFANNAGSILVQGQFAGYSRGVESFLFADGTSWDFNTISSKVVDQQGSATSVSGDDADNQLIGTAGADQIYGNGGNDTLIGGAGNDYLAGGGGDDTYIFNRGDGQDSIAESWGNDTIRFGVGITAADLSLSVPNRLADPQSLLIQIAGSSGDQIFIAGQNGDPRQTVEQFIFADGSVLTAADMRAMLWSTLKTNGADMLTGSNADDLIDGGAGNDQINAADGNDTLIGGQGNDYLAGGGGDDTYIFNRGDGADTINESWGNDTLKFGVGISASDLILSVPNTIGDGQGLHIRIAGTNDQVYVSGQNGDPHQTIEQFVFADGTVLTAADMRATLWATLKTVGADMITGSNADDLIDGGAGNDQINAADGNDTLIGGQGNDYLAGGGGDDTYIFNRGDGADTINESWGNDTLKFGAGISASDLMLSVPNGLGDGQGLQIRIAGTNDQVYIAGQNGDPHQTIEQFMFVDGSVLTAADLRAQLWTTLATSGDDRIVGSSSDDQINGGLGNDEISGGNGNDTLTGSKGNDNLAGGGGDDTYIFNRGDGSDTISEEWGTDTLQFGEGIAESDILVTRANVDGDGGGVILSVKGTTDQIYLQSEFYSDRGTSPAINIIRFQSGAVWDVSTLQQMLGGTVIDGKPVTVTMGSDTIIAGSGNDTLQGLKGDDVLRGGTGSDTYIFSRGDGHDTIYDPADSASTDTLVLHGINPADVSVRTSPTDAQDLILYIDDDNTIYLDQQNAGGGAGIEQISFDDGTVWSRAQLANLVASAGATSGNDRLIGTNFADTLSGGLGSDTLIGSGGNDTYLYNVGDGNDTIIDDNGAGNVDTLVLGAGIVLSDIRLNQPAEGQPLVISFASTPGSITLQGLNPGGTSGVQVLRFADGSSVTMDALRQSFIGGAATAGNDVIRGFATNDVLAGGLGNDTLIGGAGADTYQFNLGDGVDTIVETGDGSQNILVFSSGIAPADIRLSRSAAAPTDLILALSNGTDRVILQNQFANGGLAGVQEVHFADGTVWQSQNFQALLLAQPATSGDDYLEGDGNANTIDGLAGNDLIVGGAGDDVLYGSDGNDTLYGGLGNDSLYGGAGNDVLSGDQGTDYLDGGDGIDTADYSFSLDSWSINLSTGSAVITSASVAQTPETLISIENVVGGLGSDVIVGDAGANRIEGGGGNDTLSGAAGDDVFIFNGDGLGVDAIDGGSGNDRIEAGADGTVIGLTSLTGVEQITANGHSDVTISMTDNVDTLDLSNVSVDGIASIELGDGNDTITGSLGADVINAGAGDDVIRFVGASTGGDTVDGGDGSDTIIAGADGTIIRLASFQNVEAISGGGFANVMLAGTDGNELFDLRGVSISGIVGIDLGAGNDTFEGSAGNDVVDGGTGNDLLSGGGGDDIYRFNRGDGQDIVADNNDALGVAGGGFDTVAFGAGIVASDISAVLANGGNDLILKINGTTDQVTLANTVTDSRAQIEQVTFVDGTVWTASDLIARATAANSAPTIADGTVATGAVSEIAALTGSAAMDSAAGTIRFADADSGDTHIASIGGVVTSGVTSGLPAYATMLAWLSTGSMVEPTGSTAGSLPWSFTAPDGSFDYLAAGASVTLNYSIQLSDGQGGAFTQPIAVTITGTNDVPLIAAGTTVSATVSELASVTGSTTNDIASGTLKFTDADSGDAHTVDIASVTASGITAGLPTNTALLSMLTTGALTQQVGATPGTVAWTFAAEDETFDYLASGETVTLTYTVLLIDSQGASVSQDVVVTVSVSTVVPSISSTNPRAARSSATSVPSRAARSSSACAT